MNCIKALGLASIVCSCMLAKYHSVESAGKFYQYLEPQVKDQLTLTAVLFFDSSEAEHGAIVDKKDKTARSQRATIKKLINNQRKIFKDASKGFSEIDFLSVDLKKSQSLASAYAIAYSPEIRLFKKGKLVMRDNTIVALKGDFAQHMIIEEPTIAKFINKYLGDDIQKILDAKAKAAQEIAVARASAPRYSSFSVGVGYGYPGWGGWGWGGPYWGWGGGWGWRGCC